jgi:hypothetical protein
VNFPTGSTYLNTKTTVRCVRAFRCITY